jgi:hypothetical protein
MKATWGIGVEERLFCGESGQNTALLGRKTEAGTGDETPAGVGRRHGTTGKRRAGA